MHKDGQGQHHEKSYGWSLSSHGWKDALRQMSRKFPDIIDGSQAAARSIMDVIRPKPAIACFRSRWLSLTDRFIYDEMASLERYRPAVFCIMHEDRFIPSLMTHFSRRFSPMWTEKYPYIRGSHRQLYGDFISWCVDGMEAAGARLIHAQYLTDALFVLQAKRRLGIPMVVSVRGFDLYSFRGDITAIFDEADVFLVRAGEDEAGPDCQRMSRREGSGAAFRNKDA